ncbi:hypothetical protein MUY27_19570 [Mucilaginibacter sp. RS28]|uniref:Lipocalin-like domain-containing protein n=1 Tax=Mucilaginibacter straminoryzae TaxID=2932774 RepID=A0A9X1X6D2_9SPHI|nr:hypothetical protein [Mucilaginibacter straminoryzae]MCJ8211927.1 hypothetical protein [Mucilaginibacter straminoryzae]
MKNLALFTIHLTCAGILAGAACSTNNKKTRLKGDWQSAKMATRLKITERQFAMGKGLVKDYYLKGGTICTSTDSNLSNTLFVIQQLNDRSRLQLLAPDFVAMAFVR